MATATSTAATTALTPPSSSHGKKQPWATSDKDYFDLDYTEPGTHENEPYISPPRPGKTSRKNSCADDDAKRNNQRTGRKRNQEHGTAKDDDSTKDSKWINRDILARIEQEELAAAGIVLPVPNPYQGRDRSRATSSRRDQSRSGHSTHRDHSRQTRRRMTDATDATVNTQDSSHDPHARPPWPELDYGDDDEDTAHNNNTFSPTNGSSNGNGGKVSRIPVARVVAHRTPRSSDQGARSADDATPHSLAYGKTRSQSDSNQGPDHPEATSPPLSNNKRSFTDTSPKKHSSKNRKSPVDGRPKTRNGGLRDASGARANTRPGPSHNHDAPDCDPPWLASNFAPDPRLPPDQQIIPTVAKRLEQERLVREGKGGTVYDTNFLPLNDLSLPSPPPAKDSEGGQNHSTERTQQQPNEGSEWPFSSQEQQQQQQQQQPQQEPGESKSPHTSSKYTTMPRVHSPLGTGPTSPLPRPMTSSSAVHPLGKPPGDVEKAPDYDEEPVDKKSLCCCLVM